MVSAVITFGAVSISVTIGLGGSQHSNVPAWSVGGFKTGRSTSSIGSTSLGSGSSSALGFNGVASVSIGIQGLGAGNV